MARPKPCLACRAVKTGLIRAEDREKEKKHEFERQTVEVCSAGPMLLVCNCLARLDNSMDRPATPHRSNPMTIVTSAATVAQAATLKLELQKSEENVHKQAYLFGREDAVKLVRAIKDNCRYFHRTPVGPLGCYLMLKDHDSRHAPKPGARAKLGPASKLSSSYPQCGLQLYQNIC